MPLTEEEEKVLSEIKSEVDNLGAIKEETAEMKKTFAQFVEEQEEKSKDYLSQEKIDKLTDDITKRQEAIDKMLDKQSKEVTERIDQIEVAMKRSPVTSPEDQKQSELEIKSFNDALIGLYGKKAVPVDAESMKSYKGSFEQYMRKKDENQLSAEELKALQVGSDPDGGYSVTPAIAAQMVKRLFEMDPVRALASTQSITTDALEIFYDDEEAGAEWEGETVATDETGTPKMKKIRIPVHILAARPRATQSLLEDSSVNVENWLGMKIADKFGRKEAATFVNGSGTGQPRGFLTYPDYTTAGEDEFGKIERVPLGAAAAITADGLQDMRYSMIEQYLDRGTWLVNRITLRDIIKLKDGDGDYLWNPGLRDDNRSTLLGLPVRMSTTMPQVAANSLSVALASWQDAYQIVDRLGITVQRDPYTVKPFVEFYTRKRVGGDVINFQAIKLGVVST